MALFLFLVCSVLGAVVLAAGTAATGGLSSTAEMDRRYYSVTSAAELFRDTLNGQSCTVTRTKTTAASQTETVTLDKDANEVAPPTTGSNTSVSYACPNVGTDLLSQAAQKYVYGDISGDTARWSAVPGHTGSWTLTVTPDNANALPVSVTAELKADGDLLLTFQNSGSDTDTFTLTLTLEANVTNSSNTSTIGPNTEQTKTKVGSGDEATWIVTTSSTTTTTETESTEIIWTVQKAGKVVSAPAGGG